MGEQESPQTPAKTQPSLGESTLAVTTHLWTSLLIAPLSLKPNSFIKIMKPSSNLTMTIMPL